MYLFAYNQGGHRGVGVSLSGLKKIKDGTPLSGGSVSAGDFDEDLLGADAKDDDNDDIF